MFIYKEMGKGVMKEVSVGDLNYRNKRKERRLKKYLPSLVDDLPGTLACSTLLRRRSMHKP